MKPHPPIPPRLTILRRQDRYREWRTATDKRVCIFCERSITGRTIRIKQKKDGTWDLHCPTRGCAGTPREWVYPGNPLTSESAYQDWWRALQREEGTLSTPSFGSFGKNHHA